MQRRCLHLNIHEASGLAGEVHTLRCVASFAGRTKSTAYSVSKLFCAWEDTELQWHFDSPDPRPASLPCLLVLRDRDGEEFGRGSLSIELGDAETGAQGA